MAYLIAQIVLCLVAAFALGLLVGWLLWRRRGESPEAPANPETEAELARTRAELEEAQAALREMEQRPVALALDPPEASGETDPGPRPMEAAFLDDDPLPASPVPTAPTPLAAPAASAAAEAAPPAPEAPAEPTAAAAPPPAPEAPTPDPAPATYDDLKRISGIGPVIERQLSELGVTTYRQIARFTDEDIERVGQHIDFFPDRIRREGWVDQAAGLHREVYGTQP